MQFCVGAIPMEPVEMYAHSEMYGLSFQCFIDRDIESEVSIHKCVNLNASAYSEGQGLNLI